MSRNKPYKQHKRGTGRFVQLPEWLQSSEAWASLKPGPRALYIELKRRYNGSNNGKIILSHRDAAMALNVHRNTVGQWFRELQDRGFIWMAEGPCLGPAGIGLASVWGLSEVETSDGRKARKTFMTWRPKQKPHTNSRQTRHSNCDTECEISVTMSAPVLRIVP